MGTQTKSLRITSESSRSRIVGGGTRLMASQSGYDTLVYAAKRETLVMPKDLIPEPTPVDHRSLSTHYLSHVMHEQNMSTHGVPKSTTVDGN